MLHFFSVLYMRITWKNYVRKKILCIFFMLQIVRNEEQNNQK